MNMVFKKIAALALVGASLSACTNEAGRLNKEGVVGVGGAIAGGVIGSNIGKGSGQVAAIIGGAVLGGMLGSEIGASLDKADVAYHNRTQTRALEHNKVGASSSWRNPDSGASGTITPTKTFERNGTYCREFNQVINIGGKSEKGYGTACRQPDGAWQIVN